MKGKENKMDISRLHRYRNEEERQKKNHLHDYVWPTFPIHYGSAKQQRQQQQQHHAHHHHHRHTHTQKAITMDQVKKKYFYFFPFCRAATTDRRERESEKAEKSVEKKYDDIIIIISKMDLCSPHFTEAYKWMTGAEYNGRGKI